jgi:type III secretion protein S
MIFEDLLIKMGILTVLLSAVPLLMCSAVGLTVAILQAATQIQEQTIQYTLKLGVLVLACIFGGAWALDALVQLFEDAVSLAMRIGQS